jgi:protein disulfide-isomerase
MHKIGIFLLLCFASITLSSQTAESVYKAENEGWLINLDEAYAQSKKSGKPILANFTGSDWCGWCKRLTKDVFSKNDFKTWASDNVILLELDYPRRKKLPEDIRSQNSGLQRAFKVRGYPTIWVFNIDKDSAGKYQIDALGKTGYTKTVAEFTTGINKMIDKSNSTGTR